MLIKDLKKSLPYLFEANLAVMLVGQHGIGKSQAVKQYAEEKEMGFIDLRLGTHEVGDLMGLADFETDEDGNKQATRFFRPNWFPTDPDSKGIIFLDEINRARPDVLQAVFQLVLDKRLHMYELPPGWEVVSAMNPNTDEYTVTDLSDEALLDRFCQIKLTPTRAEWFKYTEKKGFDNNLINFLKEQPDFVSTSISDFTLPVKPSNRSWEFVDNLLKTDITEKLLLQLMRGIVGPEATSAFSSYLQKADKPLEPEEVLKNFTKKYKENFNDLVYNQNRNDLVKITNDNILEYAKNRSKKLTKKEKENLKDYMLSQPADALFAFTRDTISVDILRDIVLEDPAPFRDKLNPIANSSNDQKENS